MGNRKRFTKPTAWILALIGILAVALLAPRPDYAQAATSFSLQFNSLPSAQGWTYFQGGPLPETSVFSPTGTSLVQNTIGTGLQNPNYAMFGVVNGTEPFVLTVRARILAYEGTAPGGFFFDVRTATPYQEYPIFFTPTRVQDTLGNGVSIDTTVFHTYVLRATPGGPYTLDIDGQFAFGGPFCPATCGNPLDAVQFGDGAGQGPTNAQAEVTEVAFSQGAPAPGALLVSPPSGLPGTQVTITGGGFQPRESVNWFIGITTPLATGTAIADATGVFTATTTIPFHTAPFPYLVSAVGASSGAVLVTSFVVTGGPSLVVNPPSGPPGTQVTITGSGFQPQEAVRWSIGTATPMVSGTATANAAGVFTATTTIPSGAAPWSYIVTAAGTSNDTILTSFLVTGGASLVVNPPSGPPGTQVTITGSGFQPQEGMRWSIGTATPMVSGTAYANAAGAFTATTRIPFGAAPWSYIVAAAGASSGARMVTDFTVTGPQSLPLTAMFTGSDPGATEISVADATGFNVGDSVAIGLGGTNAEVRTITGFGSLILDKPLLFAHSAGEPVVLLPNPVADTTPPTTVANLSVSPNASGWINQSPVGVTLLAQDEPGGTGVARTYYTLDDSNCAPPTTTTAILPSCQNGNSPTISGDGQHTLYFFSLDAAGNFETQQHTAVNIDTTPPTLTCNSAPTFVLNGPGGPVSATVSDLTSGPATPTVSAQADVASAGQKTVNLTGFDNAGNSASITCPYQVIYAFTGYQAPVDNPPTVNQVNGGQAIPMQFSLGGNYGLNIIASGYPTVTQISCTTGAPVNTGTLTDTAGGSGLQFNSATGTYTYVWKTSKSWAGTCRQFDLRLNDDTDHIADFQFK